MRRAWQSAATCTDCIVEDETAKFRTLQFRSLRTRFKRPQNTVGIMADRVGTLLVQGKTHGPLWQWIPRLHLTLMLLILLFLVLAAKNIVAGKKGGV